MVRLTTYKAGKLVGTYLADALEIRCENNAEVVYLHTNGRAEKVLTVGDFGYGFWGYNAEFLREVVAV